MSNPFALPDTAPAPVTPAPVPAPVPQAAAPAAPAADPFDGGDPFDAPAPKTDRPRVLDMFGRLLIIVPYKIETVKNNLSKDPNATQERMTADVVVLDGGPLLFGGEPEKRGGKAHDKQVATPYRIDRLYISQSGLVSQCARALREKGPGKGMVLGRLGVGEPSQPGYNGAYRLDLPSAEEKEIGKRYLLGLDPFSS